MKKAMILSLLFWMGWGEVEWAYAQEQGCEDRRDLILSGWPREIKFEEVRGLIGKAIDQYKRDIGTQQDIAPLYPNGARAFSKGRRIFGYEVDITDGGDESMVRYYFDRDGLLVYGKWENQSEEEFWICEE
ncbi:MAG: hypothetical protein IT289_12540 [Oligoflexia bacterium]|nr:hypothetical protein [Oligoflexia bacterium]